MNDFVTGAGVVFSLEMRQRVRGVAWYVMLGVFFALILLVTVVLALVLNTVGPVAPQAGAVAFSTIIYFVLLLGTLVAPALSGNAINGDRDTGTLATLQITLISHWQIVIGKFFAAWATALAFLVASFPFLVFTIVEGVAPLTIVVSVAVLAAELGVVAAIGVGLSGLIARPLFSIVITYLVVAALSLGTLIAFALGGLALHSPTSTRVYDATSVDDNGTTLSCDYRETRTSSTPRFDRVWGILVVNPYVLLADAVPAGTSPVDLFSTIKLGERSAQLPPTIQGTENQCAPERTAAPTYREVIDSTTPGWLVGLIVQLAFAAAAIVGAGLRLRTPTGRLPRGSRIA